MINKTALTSPSSQHKALSLGASFLAAATIVGSTHVAQAATFNFSFSNVNGPVSGTVQGTIGLPSGDGTFAATSVIVTSAPAALGYTFPYDAFADLTVLFANSFTVSGGAITTGSYAAQDNGTTHGLALNFFPGIFGNLLTPINAGSGNFLTGVVDTNNSTLSFTAASAATPEPASVLGLLMVGSLGLATLRKRQG